MLGDELVVGGEVVGEIAINTLGSCHQNIDEVVYDDRDLDAIDGFDVDGLRGQS